MIEGLLVSLLFFRWVKLQFLPNFMRIAIFSVFFLFISNKLINFVVELLISVNNLNDLETN